MLPSCMEMLFSKTIKKDPGIKQPGWLNGHVFEQEPNGQGNARICWTKWHGCCFRPWTRPRPRRVAFLWHGKKSYQLPCVAVARQPRKLCGGRRGQIRPEEDGGGWVLRDLRFAMENLHVWKIHILNPKKWRSMWWFLGSMFLLKGACSMWATQKCYTETSVLMPRGKGLWWKVSSDQLIGYLRLT